jgi:hypothetical protein
MGDRTSVTITVRKKDYERLLAKEGESEANLREAIGADTIDDDDGEWVVFQGYEINYADWNELQDILKENLIPYDKTWGTGDNYSAGESYARLIDGKMQELEFQEDEMRLVEFLKDLKDLPAEKIKEKVLEEYKRQFPWEIEKL